MVNDKGKEHGGNVLGAEKSSGKTQNLGWDEKWVRQRYWGGTLREEKICIKKRLE